MTPDVSHVVKRGRGRPRKPKVETQPQPASKKVTRKTAKIAQAKAADIQIRRKQMQRKSQDVDDVMSADELQKEIERHEQAHQQWLKELEENRNNLIKMYEKENEEEVEDAEDVEEMEGFNAPSDRALELPDYISLIKSLKGRDVCVLDVRHKTDLCHYMVFCTGNTPSHLRGLCDGIFYELKKRRKYHTRPVVEGRNSDCWALIDAGPVIIHIFEEQTRIKYNFESLWGLRPAAEELAATGDDDWEADLFPEFSTEDNSGNNNDEEESQDQEGKQRKLIKMKQ